MFNASKSISVNSDIGENIFIFFSVFVNLVTSHLEVWAEVARACPVIGAVSCPLP